MEPRQTAWEPLLLASTPDGRAKAWGVTVIAETTGDSGVDYDSIEVSCSGTSRRRRTIDKLTSGDVDCILDQQSDTFWAASSDKDCWVVFDFRHPVEIRSFSYETMGGAAAEPFHSTLEVSYTGTGDWVPIVKMTGIAGVPTGGATGINRSGKFWRWHVTSRFGKHGICIRKVTFALNPGATSWTASAKDRLEATLTSSAIERLSGIAASWYEKDGVSATSITSSDERVFGTHLIVNMTKGKLAMLDGSSYESTAPLFELRSDEQRHCNLTGAAKESRTDNLARSSSVQVVRRSKPITGIAIIIPARGEKVPVGYTMIATDLNSSRGGSTAAQAMFLCYTRSSEDVPITDIWVYYPKDTASLDTIGETLPDGFTPIDVNVNAGTDTRCGYLCVRRGHGSPIDSINVTTSLAEIASDHIILPRSLNSERPGQPHVLLSYRRSECTWVSPPAEAISELALRSSDSFEEKNEWDVLEGPEDDRDPPWQHTFNDDGIFDLNDGSGRSNVILTYRRNPKIDPITALKLTTHVQPTSGWIADPINLNSGTTARPLYLHYRRDPGAPVVANIAFIRGGEPAIPGYHVLFPQVNAGVPGGHAIFLCYLLADVPATSYTRVKPGAGSVSRRVLRSDTVKENDYMILDTALVAKDVLKAAQVLNVEERVPPQISVEIEGYYPLEGVPISTVGEHVYILRSRSGAPAARLGVAVDVLDSQKRITFSSPLVVRNECVIPLEVLYQTDVNDEAPMATLHPGEEWSPPLGVMDHHSQKEMLPLLRFWSPSQERHFYTVNPLQIQRLPGSDWISEGALGYVFKSPTSDTVPLWGSVPTMIVGAKYLCTTDPKLAMTGRSGKLTLNKDFVVLGYVFPDERPTTNLLQRYRHVKLGDWFLLASTISDEKEKYKLIRKEGYLLAHKGVFRVRPASAIGEQTAYKWST